MTHPLSFHTAAGRVVVALLTSALTLTASSAAHATAPPLLPPITYATGGVNPVDVVVADVNGDGKADMAVANQCATSDCAGPGTVSVLIGNGDGTFQTAVSYASGGWWLDSVAVADVDADGVLDLVVANGCAEGGGGTCSPEGVVGILLGNGDGTFQPAVTLPSGGFDQFSADVAVADMNGDGRPDIVVMHKCSVPCSAILPPQGSISILLATTNGTFSPALTYASGGYFASSLAVADLNVDGRADVAVTHVCTATAFIGHCPEPSPIAVLLGNGDGTLQPPVTYESGGQGGRRIAVADLNRDGRPDLIAANCGPTGCDTSVPARGVVGVLLGQGDGTFQQAATYGPGIYFALAVADLDQDGNVDVVTASFSCPVIPGIGCVDLRPGNADGSLQPSTFYDAGILPLAIAAADVNGDGAPDVLVTHESSNGIGTSPGLVDVLLTDRQAPDTTAPVVTVAATPNILWPPSGKLVPVTILGTMSDAGTGVDPSSATYRVQDEYGQVQPSGPITLGPDGTYSFTVMLEAARSGSDRDGRRYTVTVSVKDRAGNDASNASVVVVTHDGRR